MNELKTISKTADELRVANHIILFGGRDLTGEYFTEDTDTSSEFTKAVGRLPIDWEHGLDPDPDSPKRDDALGYVDWSTAKKTASGWWVERVLNRRNEYMQWLEALIEEGMIGTSSEATRDAERTEDGKITRWPLKRDALTVNPAEPRMMSDNALNAIKSLAERWPTLKALIPQDAGNVSEGATDKAAEPNKPQKARKDANRGENTMSDKTYSADEVLELLQAGKNALPEDRARIPEALKSNEDKMAQIEATQSRMTEMLDMLTKNSALKDAGYIAPDSELDHADAKSFGDFMVAVRLGNARRLTEVYGAQKAHADGSYSKAAMAESAGTTGGWLVPVEYGSMVEAMIGDLSVLRKAGVQNVQMAGKEMEIPVVDIETAPTAGNTSYAGGAIAYWISEAGSITESEPSFKLIRLVAHKLAGFALASNEVANDARESIDGLLSRSFAKAIASQENYQFFNGTGGGLPRGILQSGAFTGIARSAASAVALADIAGLEAKLFIDARGAYFYNPSVLAKLIQIVSNPISWMENARQGVPNLLMGKPFYATGALPAINTAGDITLVDLDSYLVGDRGGLEVAFSEHFKFQNDQGSWRVTRRVDGQPLYDSAVTLENASTTVSAFVGLNAG